MVSSTCSRGIPQPHFLAVLLPSLSLWQGTSHCFLLCHHALSSPSSPASALLLQRRIHQPLRRRRKKVRQYFSVKTNKQTKFIIAIKATSSARCKIILHKMKEKVQINLPKNESLNTCARCITLDLQIYDLPAF